MRSNSVLAPSIAIAMSGAIWGVYWIPIRQLNDIGVTASWASLITIGLTAIFFVFMFARQFIKTGRIPWHVLITGLLTGMCIIFYAVSLVLTEVIKTVLLFYLTPVWSTILDRVVFKEQVSPYRIVAVISGISGLAVILGVAEGIPKISNLGDLLALLSGIFWAFAMIRVRNNNKAAVWEQVGAFYIGGTIFAAIFILLAVEPNAVTPSLPTLHEALFWLIIFIAAYLPSMYLMFWGAQRLPPARVGILMMTEIVFGVTSAALLSGEPFGLKEMIGIILILSAAIIDVSDRYSTSRSVNQPD